MAYIKSNKTFVYGDFAEAGPLSFLKMKRSPGSNNFALEVLIEFSTTEIKGKLYVKSGSGWQPVQEYALASFDWYQLLRKQRAIEFQMSGSGLWKVVNVRTESDESGTYVAVALQFTSQS